MKNITKQILMMAALLLSMAVTARAEIKVSLAFERTPDTEKDYYTDASNTTYTYTSAAFILRATIECDLSEAKAVSEGQGYVVYTKQGDATPVRASQGKPQIVTSGDSTKWTYNMKEHWEAGNYTNVYASLLGSDNATSLATSDNIQLRIAEQPRASAKDGFTKYAMHGSGKSVYMKIDAEGGFANQWRYQWYDNNRQPLAGMVFDHYTDTNPTNTGSEPKTNNYYVEVTNGPSADITLMSQTLIFSEVIYPEPTLTLPTEGVDVRSGSNHPISVSAEGGPSHYQWEFDWILDGETVQNGNAYSKTYDNPTNDVQAYYYQLRYSDVYRNPYNSNIVDTLYTKTLNYPVVRVYPESSIDPTSNDNFVVLDRDRYVTMSISSHGGYTASGAWTYEWSGPNGVIEGATGASYTLLPTNDTDRMRNDVYTVVAINKGPDGEEWYRLAQSFTVQVYPSVSFQQTPTAYILSGQTTTLGLEIKGGNADGWSYEWSLPEEGPSVLGTASTLDVTKTVDANHDYLYQLHVINKAGDIVLYDAYFDYVVHAYSTPDFLVIDSESVSCAGRLSYFAIDGGGGNTADGAWKYEWYLNGVKQESQTTNMFVYRVENDLTAGTQTDHIRVVATNLHPQTGEPWWSKEQEFQLLCYGRPMHSASDTVAYVNHDITFNASTLGGYDGGEIHLSDGTENFKAGWTIGYYDANRNYVGNSVSASEVGSNQFYVRATNACDVNYSRTEIWYDEYIPVRLTAYPTTTTVSYSAATNIYAGFNNTFAINAEGGYPDGWSYEWYEDGVLVGTERTFSPNTDNLNIEDGYRARTYRFTATNSLNGESLPSVTREFVVYIWPAADFGDAILGPTAVREGDDIVLFVPPIHNGYTPNGWDYVWTVNGSYLDTTNSLYSDNFAHRPSVTFSGLGMGITSVEYGMTATNYGPDNNSWDSHSYEALRVNVYRRPQTPTSLKRKGTGQSLMMIVEGPLEDVSLAANDYLFVFGYTDTNGVDHALEATANRYYRFANSTLYNEQRDYWVYTQWNYSDGTRVTSGKRYLDGRADELFNGSVFNGTRSPLDPDEASGIAGMAYSGPCTVSIYSLNGREVRSYNGLFGGAPRLEGLEKGLYMVRYAAGENVVTIKVSNQ